MTVAETFTVSFTFSEAVNGFEVGDIAVTNGVASDLTGSDYYYTATVAPDGEGDVAVRLPAVVVADAAGNGNLKSNTVAATYTPPPVVEPAPPVAYDDPELINVSTLAQLRAINVDLDGDGVPHPGTARYYAALFPEPHGCPEDGCRGYELMANLDFDENGNGRRDDTYNQGKGWQPIGHSWNSWSFVPFSAVFDGNGHTIANLYINQGDPFADLFPNQPDRPPDIVRHRSYVGLFGHVRGGAIYNVGLPNVDVTGSGFVGALIGYAVGPENVVTAVYATGSVSGEEYVGGLVGHLGESSRLNASYAAVSVSGEEYVSGAQHIGGLVGNAEAHSMASSSYFDQDVAGRSGVHGRTTQQLQSPTGNTGIYATWSDHDLDGDGHNDAPWDFGTALQYPMLVAGADRPTVTIVANPTAVVGTETFTVTVTFSEAVSGFEVGDIAVTNGVASDLTGDYDDYTATITPDGQGDVTVSLPADTVTDAASNGNEASNTISVTWRAPDTTAPVVTVTADPTEVSGTETFIARFAFSEPVIGFEPNDIVVTNGSAGDLNGSDADWTAIITPDGQGHITVVLIEDAVTDVSGNGNLASNTVAVTWTAAPAAAWVDESDLINVSTLAQLAAISHDIDGDGVPTGEGAAAYAAAFPNPHDCPQSGCRGYELAANLDFDENGNGQRDDTYNQGEGWLPIQDPLEWKPFSAVFDGNGHAIANLYINRPQKSFTGLFGTVSGAAIYNVGLLDVDLTGDEYVGALIGYSDDPWSSTITATYATGRVSGKQVVGGLVGAMYASTLASSYVAVSVSGDRYVGGLVGDAGADSTVSASYFDQNVAGRPGPHGRTTQQLQSPTGYTGIYETWDDDGNLWDFGTPSQYPILRAIVASAQGR